MCMSKIIGIDTESLVARTALHSSLDVLATVQISTLFKVYIFDAIDLKKMNVNSNIINEYFLDPTVTVVGHTLSADLCETLKLFGFKSKTKCKCIDVQV